MKVVNIDSYKKEFLFIGIIILLAIYYRLSGLGLWGFTSADEYYMAKSVNNILKYGLPKFETGGYYTRGILYQYISAGFILLGFKDVFALRFVAVLANLVTVPAVYLLAKKLGGKNVAFVSLFLFLFSSWEVEYARFSRYYTLFQAFFLWHLFFIYKVIVENKHEFYKWSLLLSLGSVLVYEGGIFLVAINFLPFVFGWRNNNKTYLVLSIIVLLLVVAFIKTDFRQLGVTNQLPKDLAIPPPVHKGMIYMPKLLISTIKYLNTWAAGFLVLAILSGGIFVKFVRKSKMKYLQIVPFIFVFLLILFNQIGFAFLLLVVFYLLEWISINTIKKIASSLVATSVFSFLYYSIFMKNTTAWFSMYRGVDHFSIKKIFWALFNYPDTYQQVILPWLKPLPLLTVIVFGLIGFYFLLTVVSDFKNEKRTEQFNYYFLLLILIVLIIGVALIVTPYQVGRYTFFLHPLVLILFSFSLYKLTGMFFPKKLSAIVLYVFVFFTMFVSRDYSATHFLNIQTPKEHFKEGYPKYQATMYYLREDYKTVADYVNKNAKENDVIILTVAPAEYYLKHLDYYYRDYRDMEFTIRSREEGKKELWTNAKLIYDENKLLNFIKNFNADKNLWLITYSPNRLFGEGLKVKLYNLYKDKVVYTNLNNTILVYKF